MNAGEAAAILAGMPPELELMDEFAEDTLTGFALSEYTDDSGTHPYVMYHVDDGWDDSEGDDEQGS